MRGLDQDCCFPGWFETLWELCEHLFALQTLAAICNALQVYTA